MSTVHGIAFKNCQKDKYKLASAGHREMDARSHTSFNGLARVLRTGGLLVQVLDQTYRREQVYVAIKLVTCLHEKDSGKAESAKRITRPGGKLVVAQIIINA